MEIEVKIPSTIVVVNKSQYDIHKQHIEKKIVIKKVADTSVLVKKTDFNTKLTGITNQKQSTSGLVKKTGYNIKIKEIENEIPNSTGIVSKTNFNTTVTEIENKKPNFSNFIKKMQKISIAVKYITTEDDIATTLNKMMGKRRINRRFKLFVT